MNETNLAEPVTVVVTRRVKAGKEKEYEAWLSKLVNDSRGLPGFLGTTIQRPPPSSREYTSIFRFDTVDHLRAFEESDLRRQALLEVTEFVEADAVWKKLTGFEIWFAAPPGTIVPQPSRFRMAIVMICVVYGLVLSLGALVGFVLSSAPMPLRLLVTITLEVFFMTYFLMPRLTRMLAWFIYPKTKKND